MKDIQYIYTLDKQYIGRAIDPWKRYRQHIQGQVKSTRDWIACLRRLPKLTILAKYDHDIAWQNGNGTWRRYEQACVLSALEAGWKLLYADLGWPTTSREICVKGGLMASAALVEWNRNHPEERVAAGKKGNKAAAEWFRNHPKRAAVIYKQRGRTIAEWAKNHPEEVLANAKKGAHASAEWSNTHPEEARARNRKGGLATAGWCKRNPERIVARGKRWGNHAIQWAKDHPEQASAIGRKASHVRWHVNRGIVKEGCLFCEGEDNEN